MVKRAEGDENRSGDASVLVLIVKEGLYRMEGDAACAADGLVSFDHSPDCLFCFGDDSSTVDN